MHCVFLPVFSKLTKAKFSQKCTLRPCCIRMTKYIVKSPVIFDGINCHFQTKKTETRILRVCVYAVEVNIPMNVSPWSDLSKWENSNKFTMLTYSLLLFSTLWIWRLLKQRSSSAYAVNVNTYYNQAQKEYSSHATAMKFIG